MLKNINQHSKELLDDINTYGCLFLDFAESSPILFEGKIGCLMLNKIWTNAVDDKVISGDLNGDGDVDDWNESIILDHTALARNYFNLKITYDGIHHKSNERIPLNVYLVFGAYKYKYTHFVILNKRKEVTFDPIGYSNTVKYGKLDTMRWYYAD